MSYKTYAEAKIANPDCKIVTTTFLHSNGASFEFLPVKYMDGYYRSQSDSRVPNVKEGVWAICHPTDHCSTLKEFLDAGFELNKGDYLINVWGNVGVAAGIADDNLPDEFDHKRYILSTAALSGGCKIPDKVEPWTIYNNTLPLSELIDEQAAQLFNAWRKGGQDDDMQWNLDVAYRRKPKSERELFIEASLQLMTSETERTMEQMFGAQFDAGARYADLTQHFGENI